MRRGRRGGASDRRTSPAAESGAEIDLESLVRVVVALDGERASPLLTGLGEPVHGRALRLLRSVERGSRAERNASLALAFVGARPDARALATIPGRLGACLRSELDPPLPEDLHRWARRLARELAEPV